MPLCFLCERLQYSLKILLSQVQTDAHIKSNYNPSHIPLTEWRGGTELFLSPIRVLSAEGSMPWHGDLRAETGIFSIAELNEYSLNYRRTFLK